MKFLFSLFLYLQQGAGLSVNTPSENTRWNVMSTGCTMTMKEYQRNKHHYMHQSHDGDIVLKFSDQEKTSSYKQSTP